MSVIRGRQSGAPILVSGSNGTTLRRVEREYDEAFIRDLVFKHPETLPVDELDATFGGLVPLCRELRTGAGLVDVAFINEQGLLTLVECKLWKNPQARREVVGQILDYARELSRWKYEDLERELSRRLEAKGNILFERAVAAGCQIKEDDFVDAVTRNLRQGRFLLLVVGDGIREGVEAIGEYLSGQAGLHFVFGLVEMPVFELPDGDRLVHPRILARTAIIERMVVEVRGADVAINQPDDDGDEPVDLGNGDGDFYLDFWGDFLDGLRLDASDQPLPNPSRNGFIHFPLPAGGRRNLWITVYRYQRNGNVGVFLAARRGTVGIALRDRLSDDRDAILDELGIEADWDAENPEGPTGPLTYRPYGDLEDPTNRQAVFSWLQDTLNRYINVFRPRVQALSAEMNI